VSRPLRVTLLHPGGGPFVVQAARAFADAGVLARLVTTVVDRPDSPWQRAACGAARLAGFDLARQLARRGTDGVPPGRVVGYPWRELVRQAAARVGRSDVLLDRVWEWAELGFDRWVARHGLGGATAVYGYEHACLYSLREGRARGLFCVYDVPAPEHTFTHRVLGRETDRYPELLNAYQRHVRRPEVHGRRDRRRRREWAAAHLVIANSNFTRDSFLGYEDPAEPTRGLGKVAVVPYGAPPVDPTGAEGGSAGAGPLRVLWAGTFSLRKGAHYLIDAWKRAGLGPAAARLEVYGAVTLPEAVLRQAPGDFHFRGSIPREELYAAYRAADVFVFPTLCDGFGMVVTEAFSRGLPVITTRSAGAADLVRPGENGLIVPAADADALVAALRWCVDNRPALRAMRESALRTAAGWQWSDYRAALLRAVLEGYARHGGRRA
jgi:glycosyltransferase involved in cell wall biosynthesis